MSPGIGQSGARRRHRRLLKSVLDKTWRQSRAAWGKSWACEQRWRGAIEYLHYTNIHISSKQVSWVALVSLFHFEVVWPLKIVRKVSIDIDLDARSAFGHSEYLGVHRAAIWIGDFKFGVCTQWTRLHWAYRQFCRKQCLGILHHSQRCTRLCWKGDRAGVDLYVNGNDLNIRYTSSKVNIYVKLKPAIDDFAR